MCLRCYPRVDESEKMLSPSFGKELIQIPWLLVAVKKIRELNINENIEN